MSNKLQELTDRLYNEGLSKGKEEGEILLFKARKEADEIIANARKQAEDIHRKPPRECTLYRRDGKSPLRGEIPEGNHSRCRSEIQHTAVRRHILSASGIFEKYVGAMGVHRVEKSTQKRNQRRFLEKNQGRFQHWPTKRQLVHQHER